MVKGKAKQWLIIIILILVLAALGVFYIVNKLYSAHQSLYEENWNMKFPNDMKEVYTTHGEIGFQGDGVRYSVFRCDDGTDDFLKDFKMGKSKNFEKEFQAFIGANESAMAIDVPDKYLPDWTENYMWKKMEQHEQLDSIYMVFNQKTNELFVLEKSI
ncbi:MAG: hypothetical protein HFH70_14080 [Lachnospiraceae bacterium]|nr:hypothetical protein [Lachnospiraceae bacterium]